MKMELAVAPTYFDFLKKTGCTTFVLLFSHMDAGIVNKCGKNG